MGRVSVGCSRSATSACPELSCKLLPCKTPATASRVTLLCGDTGYPHLWQHVLDKALVTSSTSDAGCRLTQPSDLWKERLESLEVRMPSSETVLRVMHIVDSDSGVVQWPRFGLVVYPRLPRSRMPGSEKDPTLRKDGALRCTMPILAEGRKAAAA